MCSDAASFDLPAGVIAGAIEEVGTAVEVARAKGDAPVGVFDNSGGQDGQPMSYLQLAADLRNLQVGGLFFCVGVWVSIIYWRPGVGGI